LYFISLSDPSLFASGKRAIKQDHTREDPLLLATVVSFEACESVFLSTSIGFVLVSGQTGEEPEQAPLLDYNHTHTYTTRGFTSRLSTRQLHRLFVVELVVRQRIGCTTVFCFDGDFVSTTPCFCFDGEANSRLVKYFFEAFTLIPTGSKSFWSRD